jgi:transcriptional regulator with XRE-family HTH domain
MEKSTFSREYRVMRQLLRQHREKAGLTQIDLAKAIDETQSYVSKCERGERRLDLIQLRAFCAAMGIDLQVFISAFESALRRGTRQ